MSRDFWDQRFAGDDYVYGTEPNQFVREQAGRIPPGPVLMIGDGEARNGVFLAGLGHAVTSVDQSPVAQGKAAALAAARGVSLDLVLADLADYRPPAGRFAAVVSIFCHLPPALRAEVHRRAAEALAPGGVFLIEAYTPAQLAHATGGPRDPELLYTRELLVADLAGLDVELAVEREREVHEGARHTGLGAVVQVVARRPPPG